MLNITPCLWFDDKALEAARFYTSILPNSKIQTITHYGENAPRPKDMVLTVTFQLDGQDFMALNGGPEFTFSPAISFVVKCHSQDELDRYWSQLSADPSKEQCGWLQDKYGMSWQIVPTILEELMTDQDATRKARVMAALMAMRKLDIAALQRAHAG
jgi:predicted 3-demethylubiquinone-9 3-methyltransferase (glyoxalase superfamily)